MMKLFSNGRYTASNTFSLSVIVLWKKEKETCFKIKLNFLTYVPLMDKIVTTVARLRKVTVIWNLFRFSKFSFNITHNYLLFYYWSLKLLSPYNKTSLSVLKLVIMWLLTYLLWFVHFLTGWRLGVWVCAQQLLRQSWSFPVLQFKRFPWKCQTPECKYSLISRLIIVAISSKS